VVGSYSLEATCESNPGGGLAFYYPSTQDMSLDLTVIGGEYSIPYVNFYCMVDSNVTLTPNVTPLLEFYTGGGASTDRYSYSFGGHLQAAQWTHVSLPIGPHARRAPYSGTDHLALKWNNADWSDIDWICFRFGNAGAAQGVMHVDGLYLSGWVLRVAKQAAGYTSAAPCKIKVITDDEGKDDSLVASDDSGTMGRLAYAEYLRCKSTPMVGVFSTPMIYGIWPGMLLHIHAKKKAYGSLPGTFNIDKDMRVTQVVQNLARGLTTVTVTDDVINSVARASYLDMNTILQSQRPEFQDRQATSLKMREIDTTIPLLEKSY